jgi:colicin import membrane protein
MIKLSVRGLLAFCMVAACLTQSVYAQGDRVDPALPIALPAEKSATSAAESPAVTSRTVGGGLSPEAERSRIQAERALLEQRFAQVQAACYQKFAVEICLSDARGVRREALADLRRQDVALNAAQARLKGAEQLSRVDTKTSSQADLDSAVQRAVALEKQQVRQAGADEKVANRAAAGQGASPKASDGGPTRAEKKAQSQGDPAAKARAAALKQKSYDEKQKQAQQKAAQRRKRLATGPAAPV